MALSLRKCDELQTNAARRRRAAAWFLIVATFAPSATPDGRAHAQQPDDSSPAADSPDASDAPVAERLLDRAPFDRVTLNAANQNAAFDTVLLDLPDRRNVRPFPTSGSLKLRRLDSPSIPYEVSWSDVAKVELYEELLRDEAERLTAAGEMGEAFEYFAFLLKNYAELPELEEAAQKFLWLDAAGEFRAKRLEDALASLLALYDRNPRYPRLNAAVDAIGDVMVKERLAERDYAAARGVVDMLAKSFDKLPLASVPRWRKQFLADATRELARSKAAFQARDFAAARTAAQHARAIDPTLPGVAEILTRIQAEAPEIRVGVLQTAPPANATSASSPDWATRRSRGLTDPQLVEMTSFVAEGGVYDSPWVAIKTDDAGQMTTVSVTAEGQACGLAGAAIARRLMAMARQDSLYYHEVFAALASSVECRGGRVEVTWRRPHIRPAALVQTPLRGLCQQGAASPPWFDRDDSRMAADQTRYVRTASAAETTAPTDGPQSMIEVAFADDEAAVAALVQGEIDLLDRVPPWQAARLRSVEGVRVGRYAMPTVHVLLANPATQVVAVREFRRALCYGIDREGIVRDLLLAGRQDAGYRVLSGPFVAGENSTDPAGYAYQEQIAPRPYEPRLATVLATVARTAIAKQAAAKQKEAAAGIAQSGEPAGDNQGADDADGTAQGGENEVKTAEPPPLRLGHGSDPVARLACQTIKSQLDQAGIKIELVEVNAASPAEAKVDLLYAELAMWDPIVDARQLLGARGLAGQSSAFMNLAIDRMEQAENWSQVIQRAKDLHRIAHYDLPVIPLWQTVNHFAYRDWIVGVGDTPVSLYQNLPAWRKSFAQGDRP